MTDSTSTQSVWIVREKALGRIVNARLTSVQFVMDYLILGFDEKGALTSLVWPQIINKDKKIIFGMSEYRNELCALIERVVKSITIDTDETISIFYDNEIEMQIPLKSYQGKGERAILTGPKNYLLVF